MFEHATCADRHPVAARLAAVIDELTNLPLDTLARDELLALTRDLETQRRRLPVTDHRLVAELSARGVAAELSVRDTRTLLASMLRIAPDEATARVRAAEHLGPRRGLSGEDLGPLFPRAAAALAEGVISERHARVITSTVDRLPLAVAASCDQQVEAFLTEQASVFDPKRLAVIARRLRDTLDPDGTHSEAKDHERRREIRLRQNSDGSGRLEGTLTPWLLAALRAVLDPLARPCPAEDGTRDPRTSGQRYHDALQAAMQRLLRSRTLAAPPPPSSSS